MLWELRVSELRYRAVLEVLDGATVTSVARRFGVSRGTVHVWLGRYATTGGVVNLQDRSSRPHSCPHQMSPAVEASVLAMRDSHPQSVRGLASNKSAIRRRVPMPRAAISSEWTPVGKAMPTLWFR